MDLTELQIKLRRNPLDFLSAELVILSSIARKDQIAGVHGLYQSNSRAPLEDSNFSDEKDKKENW